MMNPQENDLTAAYGSDICRIVEAIYRVRDASGHMIDYKLVPAHKAMLTTGLLGNRSALKRIVLKGRRGGFSTFEMIETCTIAQLMPLSYQYYIATREPQAKSWLRKLEQTVKDARSWPDGAKIIDIDTMRSSQLEKVFKHVPRNERGQLTKALEHSYVVGLAASPGGIRGEGAVKLIVDEMAWMIQKINQQDEVYAAVKKFVMAGGALSILSTPRDKVGLFWRLYEHAHKNLFTPFYFPTIENWKDIDLNMPIYAELDLLDKHEKDLIMSSSLYEFGKRTVIRNDKAGFPVQVDVETASQRAVVPYWWLDLKDIESDRRENLDIFKQENLGIPAESMVRFLTVELVDSAINHQIHYVNNTGAIMKIAVDIAQKQDLTAITVGEQMPDGSIQERWVQETQENYVAQVEEIAKLCARYKPIEIIIDDTGVGITIGDMIQARGGMPQLRRVDFRSYIDLKEKKERVTVVMAEMFKRALEDQRYKMLNNRTAIDHLLNVEKIVTDSNTIRYSGKKGGTTRDDHFWSKAMLNYAFSDIVYKQPAFYSISGEVSPVSAGRPITPQTENISMW